MRLHGFSIREVAIEINRSYDSVMDMLSRYSATNLPQDTKIEEFVLQAKSRKNQRKYIERVCLCCRNKYRTENKFERICYRCKHDEAKPVNFLGGQYSV